MRLTPSDEQIEYMISVGVFIDTISRPNNSADNSSQSEIVGNAPESEDEWPGWVSLLALLGAIAIGWVIYSAITK